MRKISAILFTILICTASGQEFTIARVHYSGGGDWYSDPSSLPNLLNYVSSATNMKTAAEARVKLTDKELTDYPYLYLTGHGNLRFSDEEAIRLRQFLLSGAFLHVDDNYGFPEGLPKIHEHDGKPPQAYAIFDGDRIMLLYTYESDLGDGWEDPEVHNNPWAVREAALKFGVNIVTYALTQ